MDVRCQEKLGEAPQKMLLNTFFQAQINHGLKRDLLTSIKEKTKTSKSPAEPDCSDGQRGEIRVVKEKTKTSKSPAEPDCSDGQRGEIRVVKEKTKTSMSPAEPDCSDGQRGEIRVVKEKTKTSMSPAEPDCSDGQRGEIRVVKEKTKTSKSPAEPDCSDGQRGEIRAVKNVNDDLQTVKSSDIFDHDSFLDTDEREDLTKAEVKLLFLPSGNTRHPKLQKLISRRYPRTTPPWTPYSTVTVYSLSN
ncbi:uncharacterized protein LOC134300157 isoform X1 [Trichomycterus rosablanca]|uniref:uncharacterized protein LOC134300157 isoform X1 n=1 Tax=Trichomycterus rosablanca TaxID=2290929 RepID=UPI002F35BF09